MVDNCVLYKKGMSLLMYVNDLILMNKCNGMINEKIQVMKEIFMTDNMGTISNYLGIKVTQYKTDHDDWSIYD